jgi:repressor LexA
MSMKLSDRQHKILEFIVKFFDKHNYPPTIREIGEEVKISSTSVVNYNLAKLEELKLLTRDKEKSRGLSLNWPELLNSPELQQLGFQMGNGSRRRVPVLGTIVAGKPINTEALTPREASEWVELTESMIGAGGDLFALRVKGNSMIDASVLDGDIVVLRHQQTADEGDMVAAWLEGREETTLKYFHREGKNVRLQPANPAYDPIIWPADSVLINGKVVSVIRVYGKPM